MDSEPAHQLAERLLADALPERWAHVQAVAATAHRLTTRITQKAEASVVAAWLHDIGYAPTVAATGFHPLDGARFLRGRGWPDKVCTLVANHTDAMRQAIELGLADALREEFPDEPGIDRDILWAADASTGPSGRPVTIHERVNEVQTRYGPDHLVTRCMHESQPLLQAAADRVDSLINARDSGTPTRSR
jgi:putative nucleotidyltransferase with HDIG domain